MQDARTRLLAAGALGGLFAGILLLLGTIGIGAGIAPCATAEQLLRFIASAAIGPDARTRSGAPSLGLAVHLAVAVGWGAGYARLAMNERHLTERPLLSGIAFGIIIYFAMQIVEVMAGVYRLPTPRMLLETFALHVALFGIPLAYVVARAARRA